MTPSTRTDERAVHSDGPRPGYRHRAGPSDEDTAAFGPWNSSSLALTLQTGRTPRRRCPHAARARTHRRTGDRSRRGPRGDGHGHRLIRAREAGPCRQRPSGRFDRRGRQRSSSKAFPAAVTRCRPFTTPTRTPSSAASLPEPNMRCSGSVRPAASPGWRSIPAATGVGLRHRSSAQGTAPVAQTGVSHQVSASGRCLQARPPACRLYTLRVTTSTGQHASQDISLAEGEKSNRAAPGAGRRPRGDDVHSFTVLMSARCLMSNDKLCLVLVASLTALAVL